MGCKNIVVSLLILIHIAFVFSGSCNPPKVEPPNQWIQFDNCTLGHTFKVTSPSIYKCSCWNHCGYRCRKIPAGHKPNHTEAPTTVAQTPTPKPTKATKTPKVTKATTTKATTTTEQTCPFGSPWVPPNQVNKRCVCKKFGHKPYYDCNDSSSTSAATTTTSSESDTDTTTVSSSTDTTTVSDTTTADTTTVETTTADTTTTAGTTAAATTTAGTTAAATTTAGTTAAATTTATTTAATTAAGRK